LFLGKNLKVGGGFLGEEHWKKGKNFFEKISGENTVGNRNSVKFREIWVFIFIYTENFVLIMVRATRRETSPKFMAKVINKKKFFEIKI